MREQIEIGLQTVLSDLGRMPDRGSCPDVSYHVLADPPYEVSFGVGGFRTQPSHVDRRFFELKVSCNDGSDFSNWPFSGSKDELSAWLAGQSTPELIEAEIRRFIEELASPWS